MAQSEKPADSSQAKSQGPSSQSGPTDLKITEIGTEKTFPKGSTIVRQGDTPENFYVVRKGKVKVFRLSEEGIRTDLTELGEGAYFGELAIVTGQPRTASVEAGEDTILTEISREEFDKLLDDNPPLARQIIKQLTQWLVEGDKRLEKQVVHQVKVREVSWFDFALIAGLSIIFALVFNLYNDNALPLVQGLGGEPVKVISVDEALKLYKEQNLMVIDARKEGFYRLNHIKGAENFQVVFFDLMFPMYQFKLEQKKVTPDSPIFVYGGILSRRFDLDLARDLMSKGFKNVMVLGSDYDAWEKAFPVEKLPAHTPAAMHLGLAGLIEWIPLSIFVFMLIPSVRRSPYLSIFCRILLGVIFIQFALSKILRPAVFAMNVVDYQLMPWWGVNLWSLVLPWAELVAGLFLILGIRTRTAAIFIGAMNIMFIVGLVNAILHGYPINCGCVGETGEPVNWWKVMKNVGMLLMTVQIYFYDRLFVLDRGGFVWRESKI
jgi:putative oxidoreductase